MFPLLGIASSTAYADGQQPGREDGDVRTMELRKTRRIALPSGRIASLPQESLDLEDDDLCVDFFAVWLESFTVAQGC